MDKLFRRKKPQPRSGEEVKKPDDPLTKYTLGREIGTGGFSTVRKAVDQEGHKCAVKTIKKRNISGNEIVQIQREIKNLKDLDHPSIVHFYEVKESADEIHVIMEYIMGGELYDHIVTKGAFSESHAAKLIKQILEAVQYMHARGVVHRDIKPENLLCTDSDASGVKLVDFGLSKMISGSALKTACGTPQYIAPEILLGQKYSPSVDIWSTGVVAYVLLCAYAPFHSKEMRVLFSKIKHDDVKFPVEEWDPVSDEAKQFIKGCLQKNPEHRPTVEQALQHPWFGKKC